MRSIEKTLRNIVILILLFAAGQAQGQERRKLRDIDFSDPVMVGNFEIAPLIEIQLRPNLKTDSINFSLTSVEAGFAFVRGEADFTAGGRLFSGNTAWHYVAPFISGQLSFGGFKDSAVVKSDRNIKDYYKPFHLNLGVTAGFGDTYDFPVGLNGTMGLSSDFENLYFRTGIAIELLQLSIGIGTYTNITHNGYDPTSFSELHINFRYLIWDR